MKNKPSIWLKLNSLFSIGMRNGGLFFYKPQFLLFKMNWYFHKADKDDIICIPHGDSIDGDKKYQLNPYTGVVSYKKKDVGKLHKKEYKRLWTDDGFLDFVKEARKVYLERNPNAILPDVPNLLPKLKKDSAKCGNADEQEYKATLYVEFPNDYGRGE